MGYCPKVLKGIISARYYARCLVGVLFLDPRSWILCLLLIGVLFLDVLFLKSHS